MHERRLLRQSQDGPSRGTRTGGQPTSATHRGSYAERHRESSLVTNTSSGSSWELTRPCAIDGIRGQRVS